MAVAAQGEVEYGEVFTRRWVVETILDLAGWTADRDLAKLVLVEPSVGSGAFLGPAAERLIASAVAHGVPFRQLAGCVRGYDLQEKHVETCRVVVRGLLLDAGSDPDTASILSESWVATADFLLDDIAGSADVVVGNPPYIRYDDLGDDLAAAYRARWQTMTGRGDIYVGFIERGLALLAPGGRLGFICADRWMRNSYGSRLRQLVSDQYAVESLWQMHDVDAFEAEVSAYPAITILGNHPQGEVTVVDTTEAFGPEQATDCVGFARNHAPSLDGDGYAAVRLPEWFEGDDLWPAGNPRQIRLLERLNELHPTLEGTGARIGIGMATGADKAYLVPADGTDVEPERLLPIVMADDIRTGRLLAPRKSLINPWDADNRLVDIAQFPRMLRHLSGHPHVQGRFVARRNPDGWWRTIDKPVPGLAGRPKLLLQDMKAQITPVLEPGGLYPHHNLYWITSDVWDLEILGGLLLSRIAEAFIAAYGVKMRGGTLRFQAQYLRKIRVPSPETIPSPVAEQLRAAFREYDRDAATRAAEAAYGLPVGEL